MLTSRARNKVKNVTWSISRYQASKYDLMNSSVLRLRLNDANDEDDVTCDGRLFHAWSKFHEHHARDCDNHGACSIRPTMHVNVIFILCSRLQPSIHLHAPCSYKLLGSAALIWLLYPGGMKARVSPILCRDRSLIVYWSPLRIRTLAAG